MLNHRFLMKGIGDSMILPYSFFLDSAMKHITTLDEFKQHISGVRDTFRFAKMYKVAPLVDPPNGNLDLIGEWSEINLKTKKETITPFVLVVNNLVRADLGPVSELSVLLKMGSVIERRSKETQLYSIALPKSLGFSGISYHYYQVKTLFPHLA